MSNLWDYRACVWDYRESTWTVDSDLLGYDVEVSEGRRIGTVVRAVTGALGAYLVADPSGVFDGRRLIPAGVVDALDHDRRLVRVALTTQQLRDAPDHGGDQWNEAVRAAHSAYYSEVSPQRRVG